VKIFRFRKGQLVWVRDRRARGFAVVPAKVRECHLHPDRHPFYPNGEGYSLDGELWWDCYPGCRVFATRQEADAARMTRWKPRAEVLKGA
jgi:hypothetical protein